MHPRGSQGSLPLVPVDGPKSHQSLPVIVAASLHCATSMITYEPAGHELLLYAPHASLPARVRTSRRQQTNKHTAAANKQTRGAASAQAHEPLSRHPSGGPQTKHSTKPASDRPKRTQTCAHEYAQAVAGVRTRTCEHVHARTHACAAVHVRACTSMRNCFAHARTCAHTNVRIRAQAHACMRARTRALVHVRTHE